MPLPTAEEFLYRFDEFADTPQAKIEMAIGDASTFFREGESNYELRVMLLAAHFLLIGEQAAQEFGTAGVSGDLRSASYGGMALSFTQSSGGGSVGQAASVDESVYLTRLKMLQPDPYLPIVV